MDPTLNMPKYQGSTNKSQVFSQNVSISPEVSKNSEPKEQIELFFSLIEFNSRPDRLYTLKVDYVQKKTNSLDNLGMTLEKPGGTNKIDFDKSFILDYYFEKKQVLKITILENQQVIADCEATVGKIMGAKGQAISLPFTNSNVTGKVKIKGIPVNTNSQDFIINLAVDFGMRNIKPFFVIKRNASSWLEINWIIAYKSEVLMNYPNSNRFQQISLSTQFLCNNELEKKPILIEFYDMNNPSQPIGGLCAPLDKLVALQKETLMDPTGKKLDGMFVMLGCKYNKSYKFLDYIKGGTQISFMVGIDFTKSNGNPEEDDSLHSMRMRPNLYESAIDYCCSTVANYDHDQLFPVFGYGAIVDKRSNQVSHCFPINMTDDPNIHTVPGILKAYRTLIESRSITLYGPTYFAPIIKICTQIAKNTKNNQTYSILMILTDGMINDWQETTDAIVEASQYPLSIIIIGIGPDEDEQFVEMRELDSDGVNHIANSNGEKAKRDIVQFVEFNKFKNDPKALAEKVFEEIPSAVEAYYKMINMPPGQPTAESA